MVTKHDRQNKFAHSSFGAVVGSVMNKTQDPDPQHWLDQKICFYDGATRPNAESTHKRKKLSSVGNLNPAMGARNQVGIGLSYRPASYSIPDSVPGIDSSSLGGT